MYLFHTLVFDDFIEGTTAVYTDPKFNELIASADKIQIMGVVTQGAGGSPLISVQLQHSADNRNFADKTTGTAEIARTAVNLTDLTLIKGYDQGTEPTGGFARLKIWLEGTTPEGRLRLWVTGRTT